MEERERQCNGEERSDVESPTGQSAMAGEQSRASTWRNGIHIAVSLFACPLSVLITKQLTEIKTLVWLQCDFYRLVYCPEGHNGTEMLVIITCHTVDSSVKPQELEICFHPLNTLLLHYLIGHLNPVQILPDNKRHCSIKDWILDLNCLIDLTACLSVRSVCGICAHFLLVYSHVWLFTLQESFGNQWLSG